MQSVAIVLEPSPELHIIEILKIAFEDGQNKEQFTIPDILFFSPCSGIQSIDQPKELVVV
jgi:hypothetical protein